MIATQSVLADAIGAGAIVRNKDPGVIAALAADDLATGKGIDSPDAGAVRQVAVNPTGLQCCVIRGGQVRSKRARIGGRDAATSVFSPNKWPSGGPVFVFCLRVVVVYTAVERIQIPPLRVAGSRCNAGHCHLRRWKPNTRASRIRLAGLGLTGTGAVSTLKQPVPYQNRIKTARIELSGDVGRAKADAPTC
jgi:hypothetical protein